MSFALYQTAIKTLTGQTSSMTLRLGDWESKITKRQGVRFFMCTASCQVMRSLCMCLCGLDFPNYAPQNVWYYQTVTSGLLSLKPLSNGNHSTLKMTSTPTHQYVNDNRFHIVLGWGFVEELWTVPEKDYVKRAGWLTLARSDKHLIHSMGMRMD